jgi:uncharacterized protein YgbK (DUF1537 family)
VPKTTEQLGRLLAGGKIRSFEVSVSKLLDDSLRNGEISAITRGAEAALAAGEDAVIFSSRDLVTGVTPAESLQISEQVSRALVAIVQGLGTRPRYLVAKGGITSSDVATQGLGIRRATVLGQVLPGVPVWIPGRESRFPGLSYIVFPGNVGGADSLLELINSLSHVS